MEKWQNKNFYTLLEEFIDVSKEIERVLKQLNMKLYVPINIDIVARQLGIAITYNGSYDVTKWGFSDNKMIELNSHISYKDQRWLIAKAVGGHLIHSGQIMFYNPCFVPNTMDNFYLDTLAGLLLVPIFLFKQELSQYISDNIDKDKVDVLQTNDFIEYMSDKFQVPMYRFSTTYQLICQILSFMRFKEFEKYNYDITQVPLDQYEKLFR